MTERLKNGMPLAQAAAEARKAVPEAEAFENDASFRLGLLEPSMLLLQFRLWRNHAHVLAAGSDRLPFVEFKGLPAFLAEPRPAPERGEKPTPEADAPVLTDIPGLGVAGFCDGESEIPCEETSPFSGFRHSHRHKRHDTVNATISIIFFQSTDIAGKTPSISNNTDLSPAKT